MNHENTSAYAKEQDAQDPMAAFREQFHHPVIDGKQVLYFTGNSLTSSTFTLPIRTLSPNSLEISSRTGVIALHGPHHSAQKSRITTFFELITSFSKLLSVISTVLLDMNSLNYI